MKARSRLIRCMGISLENRRAFILRRGWRLCKLKFCPHSERADRNVVIVKVNNCGPPLLPAGKGYTSKTGGVVSYAAKSWSGRGRWRLCSQDGVSVFLLRFVYFYSAPVFLRKRARRKAIRFAETRGVRRRGLC